MRLTFNSIRDGLAAISDAAEQLQTAQWQVSTGRRVQQPSDDPAAAQAAVKMQGEIATLDAYTRAANNADSHVAALDSTLGDIVDKLTQALTTTTGARGNTSDQTSRDAASATLTGIRDAIADDINSKFDGNYVFGGTEGARRPYELGAAGWVYNGNTASMSVEIMRGRSVSFTMNGQDILQGSDPTDVLTTLDTLASAAKTGDSAALGAGIDALQSAMTRATRAQSLVGADEASLTDSKSRVADLRLAATQQLSEAVDANLAEAITRMNQADTTYRAALGAVGTAEKVSLLDYLR